MSFLEKITAEKLMAFEKHEQQSFREKFQNKEAHVIAEIKPMTPRDRRMIDPFTIFRNILKSKIPVSGFSILIDEKHFGGSVTNIEIVRKQGLPVLYKEFVVHMAQIDEAVYYGYHAVLLIKKIVAPQQLKTLIEHAQLLHIEPLVEVDNEQDLQEILEKYSPSQICIGINARNLSTLSLDRSIHFSLYEKYENQLEPYTVFALSGIEQQEGIAEYKGKYNGVLIGSMFREEISKLRDVIINSDGHFGEFGGRYLPEMLIPIIDAVRDGFLHYKEDPLFLSELRTMYREYVGRPSSLVYCENISRTYGGAKLYLKNEGLNHTGAHKINHCVGQGLLAKRLGKTRIIAETGAGQHGLATASVCARMGLECVIYMGRIDYERQRPNVYAMELAGATVIPVDDGEATLRSAINAALRDLIHHSDSSYYLLGTACGPHPYPSMNVFFQKIIGEEVRAQSQAQIGKLPDILLSCVGGGSNALGLFYDFLDEPGVRMIGVEAGGKGIQTGRHASRFSEKTIGMTQGFKSYFLQTEGGNIAETYSLSAGLDYSGVSPQFAYLESIGRVEISSVTDDEALSALKTCMRYEGLYPALESCHGIAHALSLLPTLSPETIIVCNMSGRGEKDLFITAPKLDPKWCDFIYRTAEKCIPSSSTLPSTISSHSNIETLSTLPQDILATNPPFSAPISLMTHLVAGYPNITTSRSIFEILDQYSTYIEIQIPFSDPIADGPSIAHANEIARGQHITAHDVFAFIDSLTLSTRKSKVLIMTYYQIVLAYGVEEFLKDCEKTGIYGILIPDIPYDEKDGKFLILQSKVRHIHVIPTVSSDTPLVRLQEIAKEATGFVYAISSNMTTGSSGNFGDVFRSYIEKLKTIFSLPIGVGFGVKTRDDVKQIQAVADFSIIGTEILKRFDHGGEEELRSYLEQLIETNNQ